MTSSGFSSPNHNGLDYEDNSHLIMNTPPSKYSPVSLPNNQLTGSIQFSSQINSPTKYYHVISDEESQDSPLTPVQAPANTTNFNPNTVSSNSSPTNGHRLNGSSLPASTTPARRKSSEIDLPADEPPLKKQKTKEKPIKDVAYWSTKTVPKEKEPLINRSSTAMQFKLVRDILKGRLSWSDVDRAVVAFYEQKIENKIDALKEVATDSNWYWIKECKLSFSRNKEGELIGNVELTSPAPKIENR